MCVCVCVGVLLEVDCAAKTAEIGAELQHAPPLAGAAAAGGGADFKFVI